MQIGDMKGVLGILIMLITSVFNWLLVPTKRDELSTKPLANTALQWHNGKLLALMEGGYPFLLRLCAGALKSISEFTFGGGLGHSFSAHPKVDPTTGEMLCFAYRCVLCNHCACTSYLG